MPRALLHGSSQVAGLGLVNLEAEQLAMHVSGLITQLRKNDKVGKTMQASIDALQIYMGVEQQFFLLQAERYEHRPDRRSSQIVYMWEELNEVGCTINSNQFWTPTSKGRNDVSVIEAIMDTKRKRKGTSNHLPKTAIWYANACRLYLNVTMLNEISTPCGKYIHNWAMDGSKKNSNNKLIYPHQGKPPPHVWKVWRECILATFLKTSTVMQPTLHKQLCYVNIAEPRPWRERIKEGMKLEAAVKEELPDYIREAIGTVILPQDNGLQLSKDLLQSKTVSWTDGSVKDKVGAHSYTIRPQNDSEDNCIKGAGGTPGDSNTMTSLRAEHFGVFVAIIFMDIITVIHGHRNRGRHIHYTDSKSVIMRVENNEYMTEKKYDSTDYDIWQESIKAVERATTVQFDLRHVKGHQRETMHKILKEQGPLSREATYNDWCDIAAETERENHQQPVQLCYLNAATVYLKTRTTLVTASAYTKIYSMKTIPTAEEYVRGKLNITVEEQNMINWDAMGNYTKTLAISQRVKVMKYIYNWQNVGVQKQLHQWANTEEYMCPFDCGQKEDSQHYLTCKKSCDKMSRMCMEAINRWMIMVRTNNKVRIQLMDIFYEELPIKRSTLKIQYKAPTQFEQAVEEQQQLGWHKTLKGLFSKKWGEIQEEEYKKIRQREKLEIWYTGNWWTKHLIKNIIFWALNEWQKRNEHLHKEIEQRVLEKNRRKCNEEIMELYRNQEVRPMAQLKRYFRLPLIDKLQQNPSRQKQWIETIRALHDKVAMQKRKNKLALQNSFSIV